MSDDDKLPPPPPTMTLPRERTTDRAPASTLTPEDVADVVVKKLIEMETKLNGRLDAFEREASMALTAGAELLEKTLLMMRESLDRAIKVNEESNKKVAALDARVVQVEARVTILEGKVA